MLLIVTPVVAVLIVVCIVVRYFISILDLQSSLWGRESWLLCMVVLLVSRDGCVVLHRGAMLFFAVCD